MQKQLKMNNCTGCLNILKENFPFHYIEGKYSIDQESQGELAYSSDQHSYQNQYGENKSNLIIYYCPVCGKSLYNLTKRGKKFISRYKNGDDRNCQECDIGMHMIISIKESIELWQCRRCKLVTYI